MSPRAAEARQWRASVPTSRRTGNGGRVSHEPRDGNGGRVSRAAFAVRKDGFIGDCGAPGGQASACPRTSRRSSSRPAAVTPLNRGKSLVFESRVKNAQLSTFNSQLSTFCGRGRPRSRLRTHGTRTRLAWLLSQTDYARLVLRAAASSFRWRRRCCAASGGCACAVWMTRVCGKWPSGRVERGRE